jgi:hypothetical protein
MPGKELSVHEVRFGDGSELRAMFLLEGKRFGGEEENVGAGGFDLVDSHLRVSAAVRRRRVAESALR